MTTGAISTLKLPYLAHLYNNTWSIYSSGSSFKANLGPLVAPQGQSAAPPLHWSLNGGGQPITIYLPTRPTGSPAPVQGDIITLTEQGGDGSILYTGIIENLPEELGVSHGIQLTPLIAEIGDTPWNHNYTSATDPAQMIRDAVATTAHGTANLATCPNTGVTGIYNFQNTNVLAVLQEARKIAGVGYYYFVDEVGQVWFGLLDTGQVPVYTIRQGTDFSTRKLNVPVDVQKNYVQAFGAIPANATAPIVATYDQTGSSTIGKHALIPPLSYPNVTDLTTLQNIVNAVGGTLNTPPVAVEVDLPSYGRRISLSPNLISNPGFESVIGQSAWVLNDVGTGLMTIDTTAPHGGLAALKLTNPSTGNYGGAFQPVGIPVFAGQKLLLAFWAKASTGATTGPFRITFANPGANVSTSGIASAQPSAQAGISVIDFSPTLTTGYALYTETVTVPSGYAWAFIEIYAAGNGTASSVFFDDIIVAPLEGPTLRYWEPAVQTLVESETDSGGYSQNLPVIEVEWDGGAQSVVAGTLSYQPDDFQFEIERMIERTMQGAVTQLLPITPGQIVNATTGGPNSPASTAWVFAQWVTGIDNNSQTNNAYVIVKWTPNGASDNVSYYQIRYSKNADGNYYYDTVPTGVVDGGGRGFDKIAGLIQNTSYTFEIRAINNLGQAGPWSSTQAQVTANDTTAPAVPTGLVAIKTPRGALISWNANTEADLQGYQVQVSVGGGGFSLVTPGPTLATSLAYVAASGTALGTSLQFQVRAIDWSGNISAWSASSTAVNTDGIVFDELLVGNLKVFGTITTGGLQTAASGARVVIDSTSIRIYDGSSFNYGAPSGQGVTAELKNDGTAFFKGTVSASNVYGSTIATSATIGQTGAGAGFKLAGQFLDFWTVGTVAEGTRFWYAPDNVTAFLLAGQLAAGTMTFAKGGADANTESISTTGTPVVADAMAIASFKPNTTIALVGVLGAFTSAAAGSITPAFGQATTAGNLLVAWVACNAASPPNINTTASGWTKAVAANATNAEADIWYKANCGASETAPTFTATLQSPSGADSVTESIANFSPSIAAIALATFKPASGQTIALVKAGPFTTTNQPSLTSGSITPAFGQSTTAGNLLIAWVSVSDNSASTGEVSTTASGWTRLVVAGGGGSYGGISSGASEVAIFYKANCGTAESPPTFTANAPSYPGDSAAFCAQLAEFSGAATSTVSDQTGTAGGGSSITSPQTVTAGGADSQAGDLVVAATRWGGGYTNQAAAVTFTDTGNNNSGPVSIGNSGGLSTGVTGTATGVTSTTLTDSTQSWATTSGGQWANWIVRMGGSYAVVSSNTGTVLTLTTAWIGGTPTAGPYVLCANGRQSNFSYGIVPTPTMHARLAEFSGALTASPLDKTGTANQTSSATTLAVAASAVDAANGDLVLTSARWQITSAATASWTDSYNTATAVPAGDSGASSLSQHSRFAYGIIANSPTGEVLQITNFVGLEAQTTNNALGRGFISTQYSGDGNSSLFIGRKARGTSSSPAAVQNLDALTAYMAQGYDGTNWIFAGLAGFAVQGTVAAGNIPVDFIWQLPSSTGVPVEVARLASAGSTVVTGSTGGLYLPTSVPAAGSSPTYAPSKYGSIPVKLAESTPTGGIVTFSNIPQTFRHLLLEWQARSSTNATFDEVIVQLNQDAGATNYTNTRALITGTNTTLFSSSAGTNALRNFFVAGATQTANFPGVGQVQIKNYAGTTFYKTALSQNSWDSTSNVESWRGTWLSTAAITRIDITLLSAANWVSGSVFTLYGIP